MAFKSLKSLIAKEHEGVEPKASKENIFRRAFHRIAKTVSTRNADVSLTNVVLIQMAHVEDDLKYETATQHAIDIAPSLSLELGQSFYASTVLATASLPPRTQVRLAMKDSTERLAYFADPEAWSREHSTTSSKAPSTSGEATIPSQNEELVKASSGACDTSEILTVIDTNPKQASEASSLQGLDLNPVPLHTLTKAKSFPNLKMDPSRTTEAAAPSTVGETPPLHAVITVEAKDPGMGKEEQPAAAKEAEDVEEGKKEEEDDGTFRVEVIAGMITGDGIEGVTEETLEKEVEEARQEGFEEGHKLAEEQASVVLARCKAGHQSKAAELRRLKKESDRKFKEAKAELKKSRDTVGRLESALDEREEEVKGLEEHAQIAMLQTQAWQKRVLDLEAEKRSLQHGVSFHSSHAAHLESTHAPLLSEVSNLKQQLASLNGLLQNEKRRANAADHHSQLCTAMYNQNNEQTRAMRDDCRNWHADYRFRSLQSRHLLRKYQTAIDAVRRRDGDLVRAELADEAKNQAAQNAYLQAQLDDLFDRLTVRDEWVADYTLEYTEMRARIEELEAECGWVWARLGGSVWVGGGRCPPCRVHASVGG